MDIALINEGAHAAHNFSLLSLFLRADIVVKLVMVGLIFASVWCWAIIFQKICFVKQINKAADGFEDSFRNSENLFTLYEQVSKKPSHPLARIFIAGMEEWAKVSKNKKRTLSLSQSLHARLGDAIAKENKGMERNILFLASTGAIAPFVGLFGTVWGIMNSFQAIAVSKDTHLSVVAPGIAEALFATGLGLLAAIPAVIAYNIFQNQLAKYQLRMGRFTEIFSETILQSKV